MIIFLACHSIPFRVIAHCSIAIEFDNLFIQTPLHMARRLPLHHGCATFHSPHQSGYDGLALGVDHNASRSYSGAELFARLVQAHALQREIHIWTECLLKVGTVAASSLHATSF